MTQDAPLDQAMLAAIPEDVRKLADEARIRVLGPAFVHIGFNDAIRKAAEFAVMADRSALSRRVPASGWELTRYAMETLTGGTIPLPVVRDYGEWVKFSDLAASPIVAAPEGWTLVPEDLLTHISDWENACRIAEEAAPNITVDLADATYWRHQLATIASIRAMLAAAPSIPEGKAEPVIEALRDLYNAFLSRHGCFPLDRVTPEQRQWNDAMATAERILSTPVKP